MREEWVAWYKRLWLLLALAAWLVGCHTAVFDPTPAATIAQI
jgi:hypothetical protein